MKTSTNALTRRYCESMGYPSATVQSFYGGRRHDLFGIADTIILHPRHGEIWAQNCSYGTMKAHRDAIAASEFLPLIDSLIELWEWRKKKVGRRGLWFLRRQAYGSTKWGPIGEWRGPFDLYPTKKK